MDPFFAILLILGVALTAHPAGSDNTGPGSITPIIEEPAPCPPTMAEPLMRDLTVAFERRIYLLPSGKTCIPRSLAAAQSGISLLSNLRAVPERRLHEGLHHARSDG